MIPILYPANENSFNTNGLGSLSDATSCVVTEERNGQYELELEYPITGRHYSDIQLDTIIYAQPADGKDPQPFQVYKKSLPINGIVTYNAQHVSYRLSFIPVAPFTQTGASATLNSLRNNSLEQNNFTVWTNISNTTSIYSRNVPSSFRECLGGTDGSFLDVFGGEIEWDKFTVKLHAHRGSDTGVRIAYSKNLTDYKSEDANDGVVTAVYPYWVDSETGEVVTCGIVQAVKRDGYTQITGSSAPAWASDTYYKIKTTGYYQNDEDYTPIWVPDTYYRTKDSGYYSVEGSTAPTWVANKYYAINPYGYYPITDVTAPVWAFDTYYENVGGTEEAPEYELLTYEPYDWENTYTDFYRYVAPSYMLTTSQPSDWSTGYRGYYEYYTKSAANLVYILTTEEPEDWGTEYNSYYTHYTEVAGTVEYMLLLAAPSDWAINYTNYYTYWSEVYSDDHPFARTITMDFTSNFEYKPTARSLRKVASAYINSTTTTTNSKSLDVSFVALWQTEEYKNIAPLERVNLCDTVTVDFNENGTIVSNKLKVVSTTYDVLAEKYTNIELGSSTSSLSSTISGISSKVTDAVAEVYSTLENAIARQGELLNGGLGGNVRINYNAKGRPCEIIVGNSDNIEKMTQCLRINYKGIAFSKTGYNGPYTSIWGLDGEFDAQCIIAGTIDGNSIKAGTIQASSISSAAKTSLLSDADAKISALQDTVGGLGVLGAWLKVVNGQLYLGDANSTIVLIEKNDRLSFCDVSTNPPTELAYISNNRFYAPSLSVRNELDVGGYRITPSEHGITFKWVGVGG